MLLEEGGAWSLDLQWTGLVCNMILTSLSGLDVPFGLDKPSGSVTSQPKQRPKQLL